MRKNLRDRLPIFLRGGYPWTGFQTDARRRSEETVRRNRLMIRLLIRSRASLWIPWLGLYQIVNAWVGRRGRSKIQPGPGASGPDKWPRKHFFWTWNRDIKIWVLRVFSLIINHQLISADTRRYPRTDVRGSANGTRASDHVVWSKIGIGYGVVSPATHKISIIEVRDPRTKNRLVRDQTDRSGF